MGNNFNGKIERLKRSKHNYTVMDYDSNAAVGLPNILYVDKNTGSVWVWDGLAFVSTSTTESYYSNSYVERLKALGSNVQYSTYPGGSTATYILTDNTVSLISMFIDKDSTINGVGFVQNVQGNYTADNYNGIGLYSYDVLNEKLILIANTSNDGNIWKSSSTTYSTKNFTAQILVNKGIYYIGLIYNNSAEVAPPSVLSSATQTTITTTMNTVALTNAKVSGGVVYGHNTLPSEILNTDITGLTIGLITFLY